MTSSLSIDTRIQNALTSARAMRRIAIERGVDGRTGARAFKVLSTHGPQPYLIKAHLSPFYGGYRYGLRGTQWWLTCSCESYTVYGNPCKHAGKVALHLEREWREERRRAAHMRLMPYVLPMICPKCRSENEPDAQVCVVCGPVPEQAHRDKSKSEYTLLDMYQSA